jgi:hypothetical protein
MRTIRLHLLQSLKIDKEQPSSDRSTYIVSLDMSCVERSASNAGAFSEIIPPPQQPPGEGHVGNDRTTPNVATGKDSISPQAVESNDTAEASRTKTTALKNEVAAAKAERPSQTSQHAETLSRGSDSKSVRSRWVYIISVLSDHWAFEILSCILACACLALIAGISSRYQNKPLSEWPSAISINTIVAVGSAILKDSLRVPVAEGIRSHVAAGNSN